MFGAIKVFLISFELQKRQFIKFLLFNFSNSDDDFVYKARSIHYDSKKNTKGIYGNATKKQVSELQEEGIEVQIFPWIENKKN